jgi:hypothetical protein
MSNRPDFGVSDGIARAKSTLPMKITDLAKPLEAIGSSLWDRQVPLAQAMNEFTLSVVLRAAATMDTITTLSNQLGATFIGLANQLLSENDSPPPPCIGRRRCVGWQAALSRCEAAYARRR